MDSLLYWILFSALVALLVVFLSCIIFNVIVDVCHVEKEVVNHQDDDVDEACRLNKYHFDKHDVEDLTRIQGNFKTVIPNLSLSNEVDRSNVDRLLEKNDKRHSSLSNIDEEVASKQSLDDLNSISSLQSIEETVHKDKINISQSVDDLEFCDPSNIDVLKEIHKIKEESKKIDKALNYFVGSTSDVKYYEINESLLRLMISLCDITCDTEELRKKKKETLEYIEGCQEKLKTKASGVL